MQVDARLSAGDGRAGQVYIGKLTNEDGSVRRADPCHRHRERPWFSDHWQRRHGPFADWQTGQPAPTVFTMDVTETGSTLVYDGDIYTGNGQIAGWTINSTQIRQPMATIDAGQGRQYRGLRRAARGD